MCLKNVFFAVGGVLLAALYSGGIDSAKAESVMIAECVMEQARSAPDSMTLGEIRAICAEKMAVESATPDRDEPEESVVEQRLHADRENIFKPFTLMAHKPNYFLFSAYNRQGYSSKAYEDNFGVDEIDFDDFEAQFQLSIKTPLAIDVVYQDVSVWAGYTVRSFWQWYNSDISSPFRETNHEPEFWLQHQPDFEIFGFKNTVNLLGIVHQSNGRSGTLSRSWNRVYGTMVFHRGNFAVAVKPWIRLSEDSEDDDNPDITDYMGHGEIGLAYTYKDHTFSLMSRNNLESGFSKGAVEVGWSFPLFNYPFFKGYIQYFSGYGESLIDYDQYVHKIAAGVLLTDFL